MEKVVAWKTRVKKESPDKKDPLDEQPEIIDVHDEQDKNENEPMKKSSPITKNVKVSIETFTLKPIMPLVISHPQTARRSRGFCLGGQIGWTGKTSDSKDTEQKPGPSDNELEAARSLVGMKEAQPKSGSICNLRNREITEKQESKDSDVTEETPASDAKVK